MKKKQAKPAQDKDSFEAVARRLECDDDKGRFEARLGQVAKSKSRPKAKGPARSRALRNTSRQ